VVVVSDFLDATDWATPLRRLALRHQVVAVQVTDPRELVLPAVGMLEVVDTEIGTRLHVQTNSAELRERYGAAAAERQERTRRTLAEAGVEHLELSTDRDWLIDVARFVRRRRRTGPARSARFGPRRGAVNPPPGPASHPAGRGNVVPGRGAIGAAPVTALHGGHRS
jgi:hypothetical protein